MTTTKSAHASLQNSCPHWNFCKWFISYARYPGRWFKNCLYEMISMILKLTQFCTFGRRQSGAMVKKITLLKSYFPLNYCIKFINTFCCWWNDPPLTFQFIIAAPLMRPQKMEMRPINMLRVKVTNCNSVRTLWVMFWYHWHSKQHGRMALQHKHLLNKQRPKRSKQKTTIPETTG